MDSDQLASSEASWSGSTLLTRELISAWFHTVFESVNCLSTERYKLICTIGQVKFSLDKYILTIYLSLDKLKILLFPHPCTCKMNLFITVRFFHKWKGWVHCLGKWWAVSWNHGTMTGVHHKSVGLYNKHYFNSLPTGKFCMLFCRLLIFSNSAFSINSFRNTIRVSNSLDPDQAWCFVGPDLDPNCLQRISADGISR